MLLTDIFGRNFMDDFFGGFPNASFYRLGSIPAMKADVQELGSAYQIDLDLPGFQKEDLHAELKDGYLTIKATRQNNEEEKDAKGRYIRQERYTGHYQRSFYVGEEVTQEDVHAAFENGVLTGKGFSYGGSLIRPEATGFGAVYYLENVLKHEGEELKGKTIACAGFGNVTWGICKKATELGAKVVTLSGPDGYVYDPDGVTTAEKIDYLVEMRGSGRNQVKDYADKFGVEFHAGEKPWGVKVDVVMPSAMQNDVHMEQAKQIAANGVKYYIEVANMPTTNDALKFLMEQKGMIVAPSKAVNAGGVATSALEMAQNSERLVWTEEEVDKQLRQIMDTIYNMSVEAAEKYGLGYNLVAGANIAGFQRVADAMMAQGVF